MVQTIREPAIDLPQLRFYRRIQTAVFRLEDDGSRLTGGIRNDFDASTGVGLLEAFLQ